MKRKRTRWATRFAWWTPKRRRRFRAAWRTFRDAWSQHEKQAIRRAAAKLERELKLSPGAGPAVVPPAVEPTAPLDFEVPEEPEQEWEVSLNYPSQEGTIVDVSVRMVPLQSRVYAETEVRRAFWFARFNGPEALTDWRMAGMDWRNIRPGRGANDYHYPTTGVSLKEAIENLGGVLRTVGDKGLRVAPVDPR